MTAKWTPTERLGLSLALREDMYGKDWTPLIPAFYADYMLSKAGNVRAKASISRNYRFPTLNDLYFQPGGNPDLQPEHGFTYDGGVSFAFAKEGRYAVHGEATWFDSVDTAGRQAGFLDAEEPQKSTCLRSGIEGGLRPNLEP